MDNQKKLESRKPNRNQYTAQRKAKYEKRQEEDLYELLKKERLQQSSGKTGYGAKPSGVKKQNAQSRRAQEAHAAYQSAAKAGKKVKASHNADLYITDNTEQRRQTTGAGKRHSGRMAAGPSGTAILGIIVLFVLAIVAVTAFSIAAKHNGEENKEAGAGLTPSAAPTEAPSVLQADREITAILEQKDTENMTLHFWSIEDEETLILSYNSVTDIRDKYDKQLVVGQLEIGDIVDVTYNSKERKAASVWASKEAWELVGQSGLRINESQAYVTLRSKSYAYTGNLHIYDGERLKPLEHLAKEDTITMRGIGQEVYVIKVNRGHGYLTLSADTDYIGGNIYQNNDYLAQITEDMVLQIKEGTYDFTVENQDLTATIEVTIVRNETTVLDLTDYARVPDPLCQVTFQIHPSGAVLYLNGDSTYYKNPITLPYGIYEVRVESGGYVTYEGSLEIAEAAATVRISLTEISTESDEDTGSYDSEDNDNDADTDGEDEDTASENNTEDNTSENVSNGSYEVDENHVIIVYSDDDVEVYLDGEYMGVTEDGMAEFEKYIGRFTLELVKGTETKSYLIQVDDDGADFEFTRYFE